MPLPETHHRLFAADALLPTGWARDVLLEWNAEGRLSAVTPDSRPAGCRASVSYTHLTLPTKA